MKCSFNIMLWACDFVVYLNIITFLSLKNTIAKVTNQYHAISKTRVIPKP